MPRLTNINFDLDDDDDENSGLDGNDDEQGEDRGEDGGKRKSAEEMFESVCSQRFGDMPTGGEYPKK